MNKIRLNFMLLMIIAALALPFSCKKGVETKKNIGLQLYSLRDSMATDPVKTIEEVGKIGYSTVEPAGYADGKFYGMP